MATRIRTRCLVEHRPWRATRKNWRWDSVPIARAEHVASNGKTTYAWIRSDSHRTNGEMRSDRRVGFGAGRNARQRIAPNGKTTRAAPDGASATEGGGESGIRTHGRVSPTHAFQACSFNHSDISPFKWNQQ